MNTSTKPVINRPLPAIAPCPFCGYQAELVSRGWEGPTLYNVKEQCRALVRCLQCDGQTGYWFGDCPSDAAHRAIGGWNMRTDPRTKALVEALKAALDALDDDMHYAEIFAQARAALALAKT